MKTAIIDADFIPFTICHCKKLADGGVEEKTLEDCKRLTDEFITDIMKRTECTHYILALTVGRGYRYTVYPAYKVNRLGKTDRPQWFNEIKDYLFDQYNAIWSDNYLEADDIVNICYHSIRNSIRVSPDKDVLNLRGMNYNPIKKEIVFLDKEAADKYFWTSMIAGDSSDNIKGLTKKGVKYAEKLFSDPDVLVDNNYSEVILREYIEHFGEYIGIQEYHKNYMCLKIKERDENFVVSAPIEYKYELQSKMESTE